LDPDEPSFHLTRLLFYSETPFSSLVTDNRLIRAIRSSGVPRVGPRCQVNKDGLQGPTSGTHVLNGYYGSAPVPVNGQADMPKLMPSIPFSQTGELLGLDNRTENLAFLIPSTALAAVKEVNFFKTYGGGVLGSPAFIFNTLAKRNIKTNGELDMHRRWSVAVMTDLLCRDLPAIRLGDGSPYLVKNPDAAPFRKMNSCLQCHSTLDRAAGVVRSLSGVNAASGAFCNQAVKSKSDNRLYRINFPMVVHDWPTKASSGPVWPDLKDVDYYQRPSQGVLYYRSYDGKLINIGVSNLDEMGSALANTNDLYVCAAKRYYNMMTGISVSLSDINDPFNPIGLSEEDLFHRNQVIDLGLKLKKHQSLRELIRQIISLPT
ncbi:MAG: hypothetical protein KDD35_12980, partial [Bdellovibrionales bacterium]|nr:hypothetical protein [Bdellovibrionales bacterium]